MLNVFYDWLVRNWNILIDVFVWGVSAIMAFVVAAKIYKIFKFEFELMDSAGLILGGLWFFAIIIFGFDHIRYYLQSFL